MNRIFILLTFLSITSKVEAAAKFDDALLKQYCQISDKFVKTYDGLDYLAYKSRSQAPAKESLNILLILKDVRTKKYFNEKQLLSDRPFITIEDAIRLGQESIDKMKAAGDSLWEKYVAGKGMTLEGYATAEEGQTPNPELCK